MEYETQRKSSGVAKAGLTLGIIGTSLAVLGANGNGFLNFGGRTSEKDAEIAELKSMRYTDQIGIDLYKSMVEKSNAEDAKISALLDEVIRYVIDLEKRTVLNEQATKLQREYDILARDAQFALLTNKVECLNEKQTMIANFNKQLNELSDAAIIIYVNSTFYPAKMVIPASSICPSVVTQ